MIRQQRVQRIIIITATVLIVALLYFFVDARKGDFFPHCPFNSLTGLYCPGCGSQRAISALLHAEVLQAINFNVLMVFSLPLIIYSAVIYVLNAIRDKQVQQKIFYSPLFVKSFLVIVIAFWILRNIPFYPFNLLAPHET